MLFFVLKFYKEYLKYEKIKNILIMTMTDTT